MASRLSGRVRGPSSSTHSSVVANAEPQTSASTTGSSTTTEQAKRRPGERGRSFGSKLVRLAYGERYHLQVDEYNRVVGPHYEEFGTWLGTIVRCEANAPLMVKDFSEIPADLKEKMYRCVQEKFTWNEDIDLRSVNLARLSHRNSDYRSRLKKKFYSSFDNDRDRIMHFKGLKDPPVQKETFLWLLRFWESDTHKEVSTRNKANRSQAGDDAHILGREPIAQFIHREEKMVQMRVECGAGSSAMDDQILENVLGVEKNGVVRFIGSGVTPSAYLRGGPSQQHNKRLRTTDLLTRLRSVEGENSELKAHLHDLQQQHEHMKKEYKQEIEDLRRQQDEQTAWLRRVFGDPLGSQPRFET